MWMGFISLGHTEAVTGIVFDSTGNFLASCSADMSAKLWDLATYTCIKTLKVCHELLLSHLFFQHLFHLCDK